MLTIGIIVQLTNKHDMCSHLKLNVFHFQLFFNPINEFLLGEMQDKKRGHFRAHIFYYSFRRENLSFFFQHFKLSSDSYNEVPEAPYNT